MTFRDTIISEAGLRALYREPHELVRRKSIDHVDAAASTFIVKSPFAVIASWSSNGCDASPRGGPQGFVKVLDPKRIAFADLAGNNRIDSYRNLVDHPEIGVLFFVPGVEETLRVNGRASITTDPEILAATMIDERRPKVAVGIDVDDCFIHCAKAFRRAGLWEPESWLSPEEQPSAACAIVDHLQLDVDPELVRQDLEAGYQATMWLAGGS
jgi:PPOX class probable FMN-dependent enzyme